MKLETHLTLKSVTDYDELLNDPDIHAVHINTPIPDHGIQSIKALKAGKHVACTVPMATTVEECEEIVRLTKEKKLTYMMMETVVYAREFLFMKELYEKGELGKFNLSKRVTSRIWMDGRTIGPVFLRCIMLHIVWARSWDCFVRKQSMFLALVQELYGKTYRNIIIRRML